MEGALAPVVWPRKFEDEKTAFPNLPPRRLASSAGAAGLPYWRQLAPPHLPEAHWCLTFQKLIGDLVPGPLSCIDLFLWLRQALEPRHSLHCDYDPPVGGVLNSLPQPLGYVVVGTDPGLLECRAETLDVALRLCRVAAESKGRRGHQAPLVEHGITGERSRSTLEQ